MSVGLLVLAFRGAKTLKYAIPLYRRAGFQVIVHLDAKADEDIYKAEHGDEAENVTFLPDRLRIYWAGFNMVRAELRLLRAGLTRPELKSFALVSDDTFPLASPKGILKALGPDYDFISTRLLTQDDVFMDRYRRFFYLDHDATNLHGRPIEQSHFDDEALHKIRELQDLKAKGKAELAIHYGSQWWCLRRSTAETVIHTMKTDETLFKSFEFSAVPDESCIQTIVANNVSLRERRGSPTYVNWSSDPRPFVYTSPDQLLDVNLAPHYCFVRKVKVANDSEFKIFTEALMEGESGVC